MNSQSLFIIIEICVISLEIYLELPYKYEDEFNLHLKIPYLCTFLGQICLCATGSMFISALFLIAKRGNNPMPINSIIGTLLCIHTKKYNAAIKKNDPQMHMSSWVILRGITKHKKYKPQKSMSYIFTHTK